MKAKLKIMPYETELNIRERHQVIAGSPWTLFSPVTSTVIGIAGGLVLPLTLEVAIPGLVLAGVVLAIASMAVAVEADKAARYSPTQ